MVVVCCYANSFSSITKENLVLVIFVAVVVAVLCKFLLAGGLHLIGTFVQTVMKESFFFITTLPIWMLKLVAIT